MKELKELYSKSFCSNYPLCQQKKEVQQRIWTAFISAKRKFIERISSKIKIVPTSWSISESGTLKVEIDQTVDNKAVQNLIKKHFTINGVEPELHYKDGVLSHFTISTLNYLAEDALAKFQEVSQSLYLDFTPFPAIEGIFKASNSSYFQLKEFLSSNNIDFKQDREGKTQLDRSEIDDLDKFIQANPLLNINRQDQLGCVLTFKAKELKSELYYSLKDKGGRYEIMSGNRLAIHNIFLPDTTIEKFNRLFGLRLHKAETFFTIVGFNNKEIAKRQFEYLRQTFGKDLIRKIEVKSSSSSPDLRFIIKYPLQIEKHPYEYQQQLVQPIFDLFRGHVVKVQPHSMFSFDQESSFASEESFNNAINAMRELLPYPEFLVTESYVAFDFFNQEEFEQKFGRIIANNHFQFSYYKQNHKFKVKLNFPNPFQQAELEIKGKFKSIRLYYKSNGTLRIRSFYKYSPETQKAVIMQFTNFCEEIAQKYGFDFTLNNPYELKFFAEVNDDLKEFEENQKFLKLRGAEVSFNEDVIGKIRSCSYPFIDIVIKDDSIKKYFIELRNNDSSAFAYIKPELKGELEKIFRLENAITKIEKEAGSLPNPKVAEYIYDSSKASEIEKIDELKKGSNTWNEIVFHKNDSSNLNDSQIRGVISSLLSKDLAVIQGPPGTGKSTAISEIIWHHVRTKPALRLLLTSETHLAVDNALEKVGKLKSNMVRPIRFGVDEDDFDMDGAELEENDTVKVEAEGKRYSAKRIDQWVSIDASHVHYSKIKDNAVQLWMEKVAQRVAENKTDIYASSLEKWINTLNNADLKLKKLFKNKYLEHVNVIGATSSSIAEKSTEGKATQFTHNYCKIFGGSFKNPRINFDVVITDEASKATPPELLLPLLYGKKSIIVGDHRQLPPLLDENDFSSTLRSIGEHELAKEFAKIDTDESQFERLFEGLDKTSTLKTTFDTQYRMHSSINEVIKQFYRNDGNGLQCGLDLIEENQPDLFNPQSRWHGLSYPGLFDENTHCIWVNVEHPEIKDGTSRVNWGEIEACRRIIKLLRNSNGYASFMNHWKREEDKQIGLISFYGKQLSHLKRMSSSFPDVPLRISTVDRFQGMERNIIIVSMVRSNRIMAGKDDLPNNDLYPDTGGYAPQNDLGFAQLPNRLNVALSRAKRLLIIVGNAKHFQQKEIYRNVFDTISTSIYGKVIDNYLSLPE